MNLLLDTHVALRAITGSPKLSETGNASRGEIADLYRFLYHDVMKTTLDLDDEFVKPAKAYAASERKSLTALIEERLRLRRRSAASGAQVDLPVFTGGRGFAAGIDPSSNASIYDAADDDT